MDLKKLSLARAFLHEDSRVVVFDEPLQDLDSRSAETVSESIETLAEEGALVFWITSRYEDLLLADRVLFFDGVTTTPAVGTHQELLASVPAYKSFVPGFARQLMPNLDDLRRRSNPSGTTKSISTSVSTRSESPSPANSTQT